MSRLPRPHIPLSVRVQVAERQIAEAGFPNLLMFGMQNKLPLRERLVDALGFMFGDQKVHLDHDPALVNRPLNKRTGKYTPDANDPDALVYRTKAEHDIKTRIHGDGAQHSDLGMVRKNKRIAANRNPKRRKVKIRQREEYRWPSRPFRSKQ